MGIKNIGRRLAAMILCAVMVFTLLPNTAFLDVHAASGTDSFCDGKIGVTYTGSQDAETTYTNSEGGFTAAANVKVTSGCLSDSYDATTMTITITNSNTVASAILFNYIADSGVGSVTIDGTAATSGAFSKELAPGDTITIVVTSGAVADAVSSITVDSFDIQEEQEVTGTFLAGENGTYTVTAADSTTYTINSSNSTQAITQGSFSSYALAATPDSGCKFVGWNVSGTFVSTSTSYTLKIYSDSTIQPVFAASDAAVFKAGLSMFVDLTDAISYARANSISVISVADSGKISGSYTIPNGITLLVPFDDANTCYKNNPPVLYGSTTTTTYYETPSEYKRLTLADGASLTIANGAAISLSSRIIAQGQANGYNGCVGGKYGHIVMGDGASITVQSGGTLYTYGYISGSQNSSVTVKAGGTVWELFQIRSWRGGTATSNSTFSNNDIFPINQYYVQNIETPLTVEAGATERVYTSINASSNAHPGEALFIGAGGMFDNKGGSIRKYYDAATDRLIVDTYGDMDLSPLKIETAYMDLDTSEYVLPITNNMTVNVHSGTTSITQNLAFLPDAVMNIDEGAVMRIRDNVSVYVYDKESWGNFANINLRITAVGYSVANGTAAVRTDVINDATIDINGKLVMYGKLYTTSGAANSTKADAVPETANPDNYGAQITSSQGTGTLVYATEIGAETHTYQAEQPKEVYLNYIPIEPAKLRNGTGAATAYTSTTDGDRPAKEIFVYYPDFDSWTEGTFDTGYSATFHLSDGSTYFMDNLAEFDHLVNAENYDANSDSLHQWPDDITPAGYLDTHMLVGWTTRSDLPSITASNYSTYAKDIYNEVFYVDDETAPDKTLDFYPVYAESVTVTWENYDNSVIYTETIIKGSTTKFDSSINGAPIQKPHTDDIEYYSYHWRKVGTETQFCSSSATTPAISENTELFSFWPEDSHSYSWNKSDPDYHWQDCYWCDHIKDYGPHTFNEQGKCTACGRLAEHPSTNIIDNVTDTGAQVIDETYVDHTEQGQDVKRWLITVQAPMTDSDGNYFVYWADADGNIVSCYRTYAFYIVENETLTPVYVSPSEYAAVRETALYACRIVDVSEDDGEVKISAEHAVSSSKTINGHGILATFDSAYGTDSGLIILEDSDADIYNLQAARTQAARTGLLTKSAGEATGVTLYARAYVIDGATGEVHYGPVQSYAVTASTGSADDKAIVVDGEADLTDLNAELNADEEPVEEPAEDPVSEVTGLLSKILEVIKNLVPVILGYIQDILSMVK